MRDFDIQFGPPSHVWMSVQVVADGQQCIAMSPMYPVTHFAPISSLSMLMQGMRECAVDWSLEPEYAQWTFRRNENTLEFIISESLSRHRKLAYRGNLPSIIHRSLNVCATWQPKNAGRRRSVALKSGPGRFLQRTGSAKSLASEIDPTRGRTKRCTQVAVQPRI